MPPLAALTTRTASKSASSSSATIVARPVWAPLAHLDLAGKDNDCVVRTDADVGVNGVRRLGVGEGSYLRPRGEGCRSLAGDQRAGGRVNGLLDPGVRPAPAQVAVHPSGDDRVTGRGVRFEQGGGRQGLARPAVAALDDVLPVPRRPDGVDHGAGDTFHGLTCLPTARPAGVWHDFSLRPSISTVQAAQ